MNTKVAQFQRRPLTVKAVQWVGSQDVPGVCRCYSPGTPHIHAGKTSLAVSQGDWIVTEPDGTVYPCRSTVFEAMFEPTTGAK